MTCLAIKLSEAVSTAHATRLVLCTDFDKRIRRCIPKSCFPSDCAGKCVRRQIEVCSEVLCCCSVSQSDCHTEHAILIGTVAWHCTRVHLLLLQTEKEKVSVSRSHSFCSAAHFMMHYLLCFNICISSPFRYYAVFSRLMNYS